MYNFIYVLLAGASAEEIVCRGYKKNVTEGLWAGLGGGAGIKKVSIKTATVLLSFPHGSPCVTRRLGRGEKGACRG